MTEPFVRRIRRDSHISRTIRLDSYLPTPRVVENSDLLFHNQADANPTDGEAVVAGVRYRTLYTTQNGVSY